MLKNCVVCQSSFTPTNNHQKYCSDCRKRHEREYMRDYVTEWNKNHLEQARNIWNKAFDRWYETHKEEHYKRRLAYAQDNPQRHRAQCYAFRVFPDRQICEIEGCLELGQRHHDDYNKPYEIRWLCHKHHKELHRMGKILTPTMVVV